MKNLFVLLILFHTTLSLLASESKPNIILIMADDMGYSDIGCYGGEIFTPNIDRLAKEGLRFRQFYNNAKCTTTRASIITGQYPHETGNEILLLNDSHFTIADAMTKAGYYTILSGKWHLGSVKGHRPIDRGFQEFYGLMDGAVNFFNPALPDPKYKGGKVRVFGHNEELITSFPEGYYLTDAFTDHAVKHIKKAIDEERPYFLHLAYTAPHYPLHAKPEDIAKYKGRYNGGWEKLREERYQRMLEMGIIDKDLKLPPADAVSWESRPNKELEALRMEVYAAMVDSMDQNIGKILKLLDETKTLDNTLIIFLSDNGACSEMPGGDDPAHIPGPKEFYTAVGKNWANAQNTPFKKYKSQTYEGGIATACVVRWPKEIAPGTWSNAVAHIIDFQPTLMKVAGLDPVKDIPAGKSPLDGENIFSAFKGEKFQREKPLFVEWKGNKAVRDGDWKAVYDTSIKNWQLFNLKEDRTEIKDLSAELPEKIAKMKQAWEEWALKTNRQVKPKK